MADKNAKTKCGMNSSHCSTNLRAIKFASKLEPDLRIIEEAGKIKPCSNDR